jgi:hypothetical protein
MLGVHFLEIPERGTMPIAMSAINPKPRYLQRFVQQANPQSDQRAE